MRARSMQGSIVSTRGRGPLCLCELGQGTVILPIHPHRLSPPLPTQYGATRSVCSYILEHGVSSRHPVLPRGLPRGLRMGTLLIPLSVDYPSNVVQMNNSKRQDPCLVTSFILGSCVGGSPGKHISS